MAVRIIGPDRSAKPHAIRELIGYDHPAVDTQYSEPVAKPVYPASQKIDAFVGQVQDRLLRDGKDSLLGMTSDEAEREQQLELVMRTAEVIASQDASLATASATDVQELVLSAVNDIVGVGPIQPLLSDESITEIIVRWDSPVLVDRHNGVESAGISFRSPEQLRRVCERIARYAGRKVDTANPICDSWLLDGSRCHIILPPASPSGACLTIRKFDRQHRSLDDLVKIGSLSREMRDFLVDCVRAKVSILVSGATNSGKTTLLRALAMHIPNSEYLVTIEDTDELHLSQHNAHVTPLLYRPPSPTGSGEITHRDLLKASLRMRPDRIIVGETRGSEALEYVQAIATGHDGGMSTVHAGSPDEAIMVRLPTMISSGGTISLQQAKVQVNMGIELIIQVGSAQGKKTVKSISEVNYDLATADIATVSVLFEREPTGGWRLACEPTGRVADRLAAYYQDYPGEYHHDA
jgi:pilus assembly protein CpaF